MAGHGIVTPPHTPRKEEEEGGKVIYCPFLPLPSSSRHPQRPRRRGRHTYGMDFTKMVRISICRRRLCSFSYEKTFWDHLYKKELDTPNPIPADRLRRHRRRRRKRNSVWLPSSVGGRVFMVSFLLLFLLSLSPFLSHPYSPAAAILAVSPSSLYCFPTFSIFLNGLLLLLLLEQVKRSWDRPFSFDGLGARTSQQKMGSRRLLYFPPSCSLFFYWHLDGPFVFLRLLFLRSIYGDKTGGGGGITSTFFISI